MLLQIPFLGQEFGLRMRKIGFLSLLGVGKSELAKGHADQLFDWFS